CSCTQKKRPGNKRGENMEFGALLSPRTRGFMPGTPTTRTAHHYPRYLQRNYATRLRKPGKDLSDVPSFPYNACESRQKGTYSSRILVQVFWSAPASVTSEGRRRGTDLHSTS
ncbi:unnamed protein product, partial [Arctogadus glacialis]